MAKTCEVCKDKGYIEVVVYNSECAPDGTHEIQRCDNCMLLKDDLEAQEKAQQEGYVVEL